MFSFQPPFLKVDFNRWKDEDDSDVDDALSEPNLEDVSLNHYHFLELFLFQLLGNLNYHSYFDFELWPVITIGISISIPYHIKVPAKLLLNC